MKRSIVILAMLMLALPGCCSSSQRHESYNVESKPYYKNVSDQPPDAEVTGVTYDKGPAHPTIYEWIFAKLGIE